MVFVYYSLPKSKKSKIKTLINSDIIRVNSTYMYVQIYLYVNAWTNIFYYNITYQLSLWEIFIGQIDLIVWFLEYPQGRIYLAACFPNSN